MDSRLEFVAALRDWAKTFMHMSMHGLVIHAKSNHLSMSQLGTLFHLQRTGACAVGDISDDLGVTNAAASQMLDRLVQNGLVVRDEDPTDRRAKRIELTGQGKRMVLEVMEQRDQLAEDLAGLLSDGERKHAAQTLRLLSERTRSMKEVQQ